MGLWLRQSTAVTVKIGPFIDDTDGKTAETALTLTQADIRLTKNGGDFAQKNESTTCTHDENGWYDCPLNATDTNTLGILQLSVLESGSLIAYHEYMVVPANTYDSLVNGSASDYLQVDVIQLGNGTQSATDLKDLADTGYDPATHKVQGVVLTDTATAITNTVNLSAASEAQIDAIETDTNELQGDWVNGGRLDLLLDAAKEAVDTEVAAIKAVTDTLSLSAIADAVHDEVIEGALTERQIKRILLSALGGKSAGGGTTTLTFQDNADTKARITATVDSDGNRTAVTLDAT